MAKFNIGDVVRLKSGGPKMTIDSIYGPELIAGECEKQGRKDVIMWKLLIPRKDRKVLYEYIRNKGVSAASLFPGYEGAVRSRKEDNSFNL